MQYRLSEFFQGGSLLLPTSVVFHPCQDFADSFQLINCLKSVLKKEDKQDLSDFAIEFGSSSII